MMCKCWLLCLRRRAVLGATVALLLGIDGGRAVVLGVTPHAPPSGRREPSASVRAAESRPADTRPADIAGPAERAAIEKFPLNYLFNGEEQFSPGYIDWKTGTFYRWRGVSIDRKQHPFPGPQHRIRPLKRESLKVIVDFDPTVVLLRTKGGGAVVGYWDEGSGVFFKWRQEKLEDDEVRRRERAGPAHVLDVDTPVEKMIEIEPPPSIALTP